MASFRISSLMPVVRDPASSWSLRVRRAWMVSRLWLTLRASTSMSHQTAFLSAPNKGSSSLSTTGQLRCKAAKDLKSKYHHTPDDEIGPVKSALLSFRPVAGKYEGTVLGLGIGCFGELSAGINGACTFIARNRAVFHVDRYEEKPPKEALGIFRSRICRAWGHAAVFAWSELILDRSRKLVGLLLLDGPYGGGKKTSAA